MAAPTVTGISPAAGGAGGGTPVTVTGTDFIAGTTVAFGANAGTSVVIGSTTSLTCVSPAHAPGIVDVEVTNTDGTSAPGAADKFNYLALPTIPAQFLDIDYTQRAQVLNQLATVINAFLAYWVATTPAVAVPDAGSGATYISAAGTFRNLINALNAVNTQFTLGVTALAAPANNLDWSAFQPVANSILTYLTALSAAKP